MALPVLHSFSIDKKMITISLLSKYKFVELNMEYKITKKMDRKASFIVLIRALIVTISGVFSINNN